MTNTPKRRKYLVNARFQVRWSLLISLVGGLVASIVVSMFWIELGRHDEELKSAIDAEISLQEATSDVGVLLLNMPETTPEEAAALKKKLDTQSSTYERGLEIKRALIVHNARLRWELVGFVLLVIIGLFIWGVVVTHRIAGPMFVIKHQLAAYHSQGAIDARGLRRGDEFQDVYDELQEALGGKSAAS